MIHNKAEIYYFYGPNTGICIILSVVMLDVAEINQHCCD